MADKNGKIFGKINVVDLAVVLFVIAIACVMFFKFGGHANNSSSQVNEQIEYVLKISDIREFTAKQFVEGDSVYDDESGKYIGKISAVKKENSKDYALKSDGTYNYTERPERYNVYVTVTTNATVKDTGYFAEGIRQIAPHSTVVVSNNKVKTTGVVENIVEK